MSDTDTSITPLLLTDAGGNERAQRRRFVLLVVGGPDKGRDQVAVGDAVTVGSSREAGLRLSDASVSRRHARIEVLDSGVLITDLGSTNGTIVDGTRVLSAYLSDGSTIRLGQSELRFEHTSAFDEVLLYPKPQFGRLYGKSVAMRHLFAVLDRIALSPATVLIHGESGTGKELAAEAIHEASPRKDGPLVVVDCGSLPPTLIESELFGHEKGAFTGALNTRRGAFELAHGGTLFLDEIGEMDLTLQPRLLRAIESRQVKRVGGSDYRAVDVRVIAATNRDLEQMVTTGDFREDLYHRLAVMTVRMPPLRHRLEDIEFLAQSFIDELGEQLTGKDPFALTPQMVGALTSRRWPGNVRELKNYIERAVVLSTTDLRDPDTTGRAAPLVHDASVDFADMPYAQAREAAIADFEARYIQHALERSGGNVAKAARQSQMDRVYLFRLLRKHNVSKPKKRDEDS